MTLGEKIKRIRLNKGMTQEELAGRIGIEPRTLQNIEAGNTRRPRHLSCIAEALEMSLEELQQWMPINAPEAGLESQILSFDALIDHHTQNFVGRADVLDALDGFISTGPSGYFFVVGDPGIGKTAFLSHLVRTRDIDTHHFNIALQSINTPRQFHQNICARLIRQFGLPYSDLPNDIGKDGAFLNKLLHDAANAAEGRRRVIVAVDALDEVDRRGGNIANCLHLPGALPNGVFLVATGRRSSFPTLHESRIFQCDLGEGNNASDVRKFVEARLDSPAASAWIKAQGLTKTQVADELTARGEGNFMYMRHVLDDIETGTAPATIDHLPQGLQGYYRHHWFTLCRTQVNASEEQCTLIIGVLAAAQEAITLKQLERFTKAPPSTISHVCQSWIQFLHVTRDGEGQQAYRIYHKAFADFLSQEIDDGLLESHRVIANSILDRLHAD